MPATRFEDMSSAEMVEFVARRTTGDMQFTCTQPSPEVAWGIRHIVENHADGLRLSELAEAARMSKFHFLQRFREETGMTPGTFLQHVRICNAMLKLSETNQHIRDVARDVGYRDPTSLSRAFHRMTGRPPYQYRRRSRHKRRSL